MPILIPVNKKIHKTKFKIEAENTNLQIVRKHFVTPFFGFRMKGRQISHVLKILKDLTEAN